MSDPNQPPAHPDPDQPAGSPPPYGQQPPQYGQPQHGQPGQQPPAYGQPQYGQPQYGQPGPGAPGGQPGYQGYPQGSVPPGGGYSTELSPQDQRMWAMLAHLGNILFLFLAPLIVYLVQKDRGLFVRDQSREALNFGITLAIGWVAASILQFVLIGYLMMPVLVIAGILFPILAAIAANKGESYRYPVTLRLVS